MLVVFVMFGVEGKRARRMGDLISVDERGRSATTLYGLVVSDALGISSGHGGSQVGSGELTDDGGWLLALLFVHELVVALQGAHRLDLAAIDGFLLELLAELELDGGVLEGRGGVEGVLIALLDQFDRWRDAVAELAEHHADTCVEGEERDDKISVVEFLWDAYRLGSGIAQFCNEKKKVIRNAGNIWGECM